MTTTTDAAARIRAMVEQVKGRHYDYHFSRIVPMGNYCNSCGDEWPCDAARLAGAVETLVTALEWYADEDNWQNETPGTWVDDEGDAADQVSPAFLGKVFVEDVGDVARRALADAARELEGE